MLYVRFVLLNARRPAVALAFLVGLALTGRFSAANTFTNANIAGLSLNNGKIAWADYNDDGFVDLSSGGMLYRNNSGTGFTFVGTVSGDGIWGDYDNDGFPDYFSYNERTLHRNLSGNGFSSVALPSFPQTYSRGASWGDHDNDGYLDVYVGAYEAEGTYWPDVMLRNNGGASFSHTWTQPNDAIVTGGRPRPARGITSADFDRDGDIDIYVSNYRLEPNQLRVNDGNGNFSEQAVARGVEGGQWQGAWGHSIGSVWGDFNNDGEIDIFAGHFAHPENFFGCCHPRQTESQFFRNRGAAGSYTFENMGQGGIQWQESYASPAAGDYDNDGDLDLFFTTVYPSDAPRLYRNDGNFNFTNVTSSAGLGGIGDTYQAGFGDFNNDGFLDLISGARFYVNDGNNNHWLKIKLVGDGTSVNRDAIGAQVRIQLGGQTLTRQVEAGTGEGNQNEKTLHFGLGSHSGPVDLDILWPGGISTQVTNLNVDQLHTIPLAVDLQEYQWIASGDGNWHAPGNWFPNTDPNSNEAHAMLNGASQPTATIDVLLATTLAKLEIDGGTEYRVEGHGDVARLKLDTRFQDAEIEVAGGEHVLDLPIEFERNGMVHVSAGATLQIDGVLELGAAVTKTGGGTLNLEGGTTDLGGVLQLAEGDLTGGGEVNGDLTATGGRILPGSGVGPLDVSGNVVLGEDVSLMLDIAGPSLSLHDHLLIDGAMTLDGTIDVNFSNSFAPQPGQQFLVVIADSIVDGGVELAANAARNFNMSVFSSTVVLTAIEVPTIDWSGAGTGSWETSTNWSPATVPNGNNVTARLVGSNAPTTQISLNSGVHAPRTGR